MSDHFPADCITRRELQALVSRVLDMVGRTHGELSKSLSSLSGAAAAVDGVLACMAEDVEADSRRHRAVFESSPSFRTTWFDNQFSMHTSEGRVSVKFGQQVLSRVGDDGKAAWCVATGRYRVVLGDRRYAATTDPRSFHAAVAAYLDKYRHVLPDGVIDNCLNHLFDANKEGFDAVQVGGPAPDALGQAPGRREKMVARISGPEEPADAR